MLQNVTETLLAIWADGSMAKPAVWIVMFLHLLLHVLGQLPAPQNVKLNSVNFKHFATWKPGTGSPPGTRYTVEYCTLRNANRFIPVEHCINISMLSCDLSRTFTTFRDLYWVRVRSATSTGQSNGAESNELYPLRDSVLGPPIINVTSDNQIIEVTLDMPLTPQRENDKLKTVKDIDRSLKYVVILLNKDGSEYATETVWPDDSGKGYYQFKNLKSKFTYCVVTRFDSVSNHNTKDSRKICTTTSPQNTNIMWIAPLVAGLLFIAGAVITAVVIWLLKEFTCLCLTKSQLPKSLVIISEELQMNLQCKESNENPEGDRISFLVNDDSSNNCQLEFQSTDPAYKLQLTSGNCITDTDENVSYQCNGLSGGSYEHNSLLNEPDVCMYRTMGNLPSYIPSSFEDKDSASSTQQNNPGIPVPDNLQSWSSLRDVEEARGSNIAENISIEETLQCNFNLFQEIQVRPMSIELWNSADVPLSTVKLCFNNDSDKDNSAVDAYGDGISNFLKTEDFCSQFTCDLATADDQSLNGNPDYQEQFIKLPQFITDCKFQSLTKKRTFPTSQTDNMQFSGYEPH
ncbi:interferon gamma receptor 1-like isoform X2 [Stegostoma tigrinum]|uniref:interferon gamma receptor 1-like isoform X2 n=1 Tax=Stegostoma tigrinum TaxID=3053191 RepID=UPI00202B70CD|nr:interferon gamma receptor 1-like isoform X2 [Stegostoma tigrinum]